MRRRATWEGGSARYFPRGVGAHADGSRGHRKAAGLRSTVLLLAAIVSGAAILGARSNAQSNEVRGTSAYDDPDKPVLSYLLSEPENAYIYVGLPPGAEPPRT